MYCIHCGKQIEEETAYCCYCGMRQRTAPEQVDPENGSDQSEIGFSLANSKYIKPYVLDTRLEPYEQPAENLYEESNRKSFEIPTKQAIENPFDNSSENMPGGKKSLKSILISLSHKKLLVGASILILCIMMISFYLIRSFKQSEPATFTFITKHAIEVYSSEDLNQTYIFNTEGDILHTLEGYYEPYYCTDKTSAIMVNMGSEEREFYYVNSKELTELEWSDDIRGCSISDNGRYLTYVMGNMNRGSELYRYDSRNKERKLLDKTDDGIFLLMYCSKDNNQIVYRNYNMKNFNSASDDTRVSNPEDQMLVYQIIGDGKPEPLEDINLLAASDDSSCMYYSKESSLELYVKRDEDIFKLASDINNSSIYFNRDATETICTDVNKTYISIQGKERQVLSDGVMISLITPKGTLNSLDNMTNSLKRFYIDSFQNKVILTSDQKLHFIDKDYHAREIGEIAENSKVSLSKDGNQLMYSTPDMQLIRVTNLKGTCTKEIICDNTDRFIASDDLSEVYYINQDDLYYWKTGRMPVQIREGVSEINWNSDRTVALFQSGATYDDRRLYYSLHGSEAVEVPDSDHIVQIFDWNYGTAFRKDTADGFRLYYNTSGIKMKLILEQPAG